MQSRSVLTTHWGVGPSQPSQPPSARQQNVSGKLVWGKIWEEKEIHLTFSDKAEEQELQNKSAEF